ncbi:hypothetical protein [Mycobacterium sp. E342]|uniref:hypothetical protein n=1 Tax=Mycobacterium sp. E342 TaxID=1834147 RepID=UPI000AB0D3CC|nr:hypothetical protein [Mycobacterium sp. E342]
MTGAMDPADRLASERDLLSLYLDELQKNGADELPHLEDAFLAHRRHPFRHRDGRARHTGELALNQINN